MSCGVWGLPCGDWIAAVVTAQWLMFEERCLIEGGACFEGGCSLRVGSCLEGGWVPALRVRVVAALRGGGAALWLYQTL